jgi:acetyl esterase/lipase
MIARDRSHPPLAGQVLVAPMLDPCAATASLRETMGDATALQVGRGLAAVPARPDGRRAPVCGAGRARRLAGLPPALVLAGQDDPMRDEAVRYAKRLRRRRYSGAQRSAGPRHRLARALEQATCDRLSLRTRWCAACFREFFESTARHRLTAARPRSRAAGILIPEFATDARGPTFCRSAPAGGRSLSKTLEDGKS